MSPARLSLLLAAAVSSVLAQDAPKVNDPALQAALFASEPLIQTPIGMTFDKKGRLIVIESHTHFRPKNWTGPEHDQIVCLSDTNSDGKADKREVIFADSDMTMDIATHPDGSLYLSTRNEILRLRDKDGDGTFETVDRKLVWLETEGKYPHNGLSGLAFDAKGSLYFGMGENLGAAYTLKGTDSATFSDQGEGGNIWHCTADGKRLRKIATGFWNPFGVCTDSFGNVFATDNDPDSSPPCRLQHIIEGGDYGYQFRYGRSGLHPFISWNGELPGTLPMLGGTGEAPCDIIFYAPPANPKFAGLSTKWHGTLLVASWVDHRIESWQLTPKDGTFKSKLTLLAEGGQDFRPVAFATAPDGSLFVSDWVKRDYELHGQGRVWRIAAKEPAPLAESPVKPWPADPDTELRERIMWGPTPSDKEVAQWLTFQKPYLVSAVIWRLAREGQQLRYFSTTTMGDPHVDVMLLLAARTALQFEGVPLNDVGSQMIARALANANDAVVLTALKWISDARFPGFAPLIEARLKDASVSASVYYAGLTTLARLESATTSEAQLVDHLKKDITDPEAPISRKKLALEIIPDRDKHLTSEGLEPLLGKATPEEKEWLVHFIGTLRDPKREALMHKIAFDDRQEESVRIAALQHCQPSEADASTLVEIALTEAKSDKLRIAALQAAQGASLKQELKDKLAKLDHLALKPLVSRLLGKPFFPLTRPDFGNIVVWKNYLQQVPSETDLANGRNVFMSPKLGSCAVCHRVEGIGGIGGPNLATIGKATDPAYLLESLLQPNRNVAPQYEAFMLTTADGKSATAFRLIERGNTHTYVDLGGNTFDVNIKDIVARAPLPVSIMPEGLVNKLTDTEVRDLIAYLAHLSQR